MLARIPLRLRRTGRVYLAIVAARGPGNHLDRRIEDVTDDLTPRAVALPRQGFGPLLVPWTARPSL